MVHIVNMTPAAALSALDHQLAAHGQTMTLRRYTGPTSAPLSTWTDTLVIAKEGDVTEDEIAAGIFSSGRKLILSPTHTGPGPVVMQKDAMIEGATKRLISAWRPKKIRDVVVRIECQVKGG